MASCDSGNVGTVVRPGASFAHALHQGGVPLLVASQFPLSTEGSVPLVATLYSGLLWGGNPLLLLQEIRAELHARYTSRWHDWASLVVYEALPQALGEQLDRVRYFQSRRALDAALERIDRAVREVDASSASRSFGSSTWPSRTPWSVFPRRSLRNRMHRLRGSSRKRLAQAAFTLGAQTSVDLAERKMDACDLLDTHGATTIAQFAVCSSAMAALRSGSLRCTGFWFRPSRSRGARQARDRAAGKRPISADMHCEHPDMSRSAPGRTGAWRSWTAHPAGRCRRQ